MNKWKLGRWALNAALVAASVLFCLLAFWAADLVSGAVMCRFCWPGRMGLAFTPGDEIHYETHDYVSVEKINSLGLRDVEMPLHKSRALRILAIGDSFTFGWGVNLEDTWVKRLEKNLRDRNIDAEVVNCGMPGGNPADYAVMAGMAIPVLRPDFVIVGVLQGDDLQQTEDKEPTVQRVYPNLFRLYRYLMTPRKRPAPMKMSAEDLRKLWADVAKENLASWSGEQRARYDAIEEDVKQAFLEGRLNPWMLGHTTGAPDYFLNVLSRDHLRAQMDNMTRQFRRIVKVARRYGVGVVALGIPEGAFVNREAYGNVQRIGFKVAPETLQTTTPDDAAAECCKSAGLRFYGDATRGFRKAIDRKGLYFELDRHMSPAGHALFADIVTPVVAGVIGGWK